MYIFIKTLLPRRLLNFLIFLNNNYISRYSVRSYSQEGEDMILRRIFENKNDGFYVDVGAHHPFRFSNTYHFYKRGWRGINIDAMPGSMVSFEKFRSRDINLEFPIASSDQVLTYFSFNEPALNGFSEELSRQRHGQNGYLINKEIKLKTIKLSSLLDEHLSEGTEIDFLNIDVEGFDLDILISNNWLKYKPRYILIEILNCSLPEIEKAEISLFLKKNNYEVYAKAVNTVFFVRCEMD